MSTTTTVKPENDPRLFAWFRTLGKSGRRAFVGSFGGFGLDAYDYQVLPLALPAITAAFGISAAQGGLLSTTTLVASAVGGAVTGVLADRIGRVRTLILTVAAYAVFTVLCGFATSYESLLVLRTLQGFGFGGEWAAGAILVAEYAHPRYRGRAVAFVQSSWAVGWGLSVLAYTLVFALVSEDLAWRVLFWTGALPALLVLYLRRKVTDPPEATRQRQAATARGSFTAIFRGDVGRTTLFATVLATGVQGGYYTLISWVPSYLDARGLDLKHTSGYLALLISGSFLGYVCGGYVADWLGRKKTFAVFAALSAVLLVAYTNLPASAGGVVALVGFPLGFCTAAMFSGFGSYLAELYPTALRGSGQGFTYNVGRGLGAAFPTVVGFLAASAGFGAAMTFGAVPYLLAALALLGLPETIGRELGGQR